MIKDYSAEWPEKFHKEAKIIQDTLNGFVISIKHIGSTSIPGLSAKPIIDIAVLTESISDTSVFAGNLEKIGYRYKPDMSSVERIFLRKGHPAEYHLSITESKYLYWTRQMLFRNYLRNHPEAVKEYEEIKKRLSSEAPEEDLKDLSRSKSYNAGKTPFVEKILLLAQDAYVKKVPQVTVSGVVGCLKLISAGKRVVIGATQGTETLASANDVFSSISPNFKNWGCDKAEQATPDVAVEVYEQIEDADYPKIFASLGQNLDRLTLTTPQIKSFVMNHAKDYLLGAEWTCFRFLFKVGNEFFIADVRILKDGNREVRVTRFLDGSVRHAEYRHRIVVPLLIAN